MIGRLLSTTNNGYSTKVLDLSDLSPIPPLNIPSPFWYKKYDRINSESVFYLTISRRNIVGEIVGTIAKSVLVAVIGSAATILINEYWGSGSEPKSEQLSQFGEDEHRPSYRF